MKLRAAIRASALMLAAFVAACGQGGSGRGNEPLAMVNGEPVTHAEYQSRLGLQSLGFAGVTGVESAGSDAKVETLGLIIEEKLLLQEAARRGVSVPASDVEAAYSEAASDYSGNGFQEALRKAGLSPSAYRETLEKKLLIDKLVHQAVFDNITVPDRDARSYFGKHSDEFVEPESVRASQIVLDTSSGAEKALKRVREGADFARVAKELSLSPDGHEGGDLGYFSKGEMPPEFDVVFSMKPGDVSDVLETPYGFHVFKLIDRRETEMPTYEASRTAVIEKLRQKRFEEAYSEWMARLRNDAKVEVSEDFMDRL